MYRVIRITMLLKAAGKIFWHLFLLVFMEPAIRDSCVLALVCPPPPPTEPVLLGLSRGGLLGSLVGLTAVWRGFSELGGAGFFSSWSWATASFCEDRDRCTGGEGRKTSSTKTRLCLHCTVVIMRGASIVPDDNAPGYKASVELVSTIKHLGTRPAWS